MDYEELRNKNIAERRALFSDFFQEIGEKTADLKNEIGVARRNRGYDKGEGSRNGARIKRKYTHRTSHLEFQKKYNTRSRAHQNSTVAVEDEDDDDSYSTRDVKSREMNEDEDKKRSKMRERLKVIFPFANFFDREEEEEILDDWERDEDIIRTREEIL